MAVHNILRICIPLILYSVAVSTQDQFGELVCKVDGDILTATLLVFKNMSTFEDVYLTDGTRLDMFNGMSGCEMEGTGNYTDPVRVFRSVDTTTDQPMDGDNCGLIVVESGVIYEWRVRTQHESPYIKLQDKLFIYRCNVTAALPVVITYDMTFLIPPIIDLNPTSETLQLSVVDENNNIIISTDIGKDIALRLKFKYDNIALDPPNLALGKTTFQSSDSTSQEPSENAVDGNTSPTLLAGSCSQTDPTDAINLQYWEVDLGDLYDISEVRITNRADNVGDQLESIEVLVGVTAGSLQSCHTFQGPGVDGATYTLICDEILTGRYVRIKKNVPGLLTFCEVEVYGVDLGPYGVYCKELIVTPDANHEIGRHDILLSDGCPNTQYSFLQAASGFRKRVETSPMDSLFFSQTGWMTAARFDRRNNFEVTEQIYFVCKVAFCWRPGDKNCDDYCAASNAAASGRRRRSDMTLIDEDTTVSLTTTLTLNDATPKTTGKRSGFQTTYIYLLVGLGVFLLVMGAIFVAVCACKRRRRQNDMKYKHYHDNSSAVSECASRKKSSRSEMRGSSC